MKTPKIIKSESQIQNEIIALLLHKQYLVIRHNSGMFKVGNRYIRAYTIKNNGNSKGLSDLQIIKDGKTCFIEVKNDKGKNTNSQNEFAELCKRFNTQVYTFKSWVEVYEFLKKGEL